MTGDRWREIERLCQEALDREPGERGAFLDAACGDDADLRAEVGSLLAQQPAAGGFLETPALAGGGRAVLAPGTRLGPYEVTALLGAGGMGEVYRARDTRLARDVALKVLPPVLGADPDRRRRFEQEARAASALKHPGICTLYDVGSERGVDFLVMELLEGQTLAERLRKGALPVAQALDYGAQIADALAEAHRQGIVHRDLKPANIMLTRSGAKLLDFGVARLKPEAFGGSVAASLAPTPRSDPATLPGTIVGTLSYMAPEQLEGRETDARSDLFAFGCVLYEMLCGQRAFDGPSAASVASAVLSSQPRPISELAPAIPGGLDHVVRSCLAKDPEERLQDAHDVVHELRWVRQGLDAPGRTGNVGRLARRERLLWGLATASLLALSIVGWLRRTPTSQPGTPPERLDLVPPAGVTLATSSFATLALSPDGQTIVFAGDSRDGRQLYIRRLDRPGAEPLAGTEGGATLPFFSPDGRAVGFWLPTGVFMQVPIAGGTPSALAGC